ncbi:hypothetical protein ABC99_04125 [Salmonella enterica]|uniref:Uncharacterized protein n=1 Tax=Salmonella enterica TaxID=28901 RepID=A0A5U3R5R0_SALER|nr:hypothetical protein [Salmonella enterica]EBP6408346.1 hypothetical protein [Salmonella enterica]EBP7111221.1 hypothetical protein [Salmonella enterica]
MPSLLVIKSGGQLIYNGQGNYPREFAQRICVIQIITQKMVPSSPPQDTDLVVPAGSCFFYSATGVQHESQGRCEQVPDMRSSYSSGAHPRGTS